METNWAVVFDKLFRAIDGPKGTQFYYSGPDFLEKMRCIKSDTPEYPSLIAQRNGMGRSTARRDYFRDLFYELDEVNKLKFVNVVIVDLESRGHPQCQDIRNLVGGGAIAPGVAIPEDLWNADRLNEMLSKIDVALGTENPDRVLTLCYTCMEGFFKAYVRRNVPSAAEENEITALARIVKETLRERNPTYPGEIFNVITQTAYALNKIRDKFSESHFADEPDQWAAMYARDLVNTHVRLILHFI